MMKLYGSGAAGGMPGAGAGGFPPGGFPGGAPGGAPPAEDNSGYVLRVMTCTIISVFLLKMI